MTLGEGIVWSTLIALVAIAIWRTTVNKKWKVVGIVIGGLVLLGVVIGVGFWGWDKYEHRPQVVTGLIGVTLGMSPVEVTLALGRPTTKFQLSTDKDELQQISYLYRGDNDDSYIHSVTFLGRTGEMKVAKICDYRGDSAVLGFSQYDDEKSVVEKLGPPGKTSIRADGLAKIISYPQWKAAYFIEKRMLQGVCASESGVATYTDEFDPTATNPFDQFDELAKKPWEVIEERPKSPAAKD